MRKILWWGCADSLILSTNKPNGTNGIILHSLLNSVYFPDDPHRLTQG